MVVRMLGLTGCRRTCSRLPLCIAPRRWYDWALQQVVLQNLFDGNALVKTGMSVDVGPWTLTDVTPANCRSLMFASEGRGGLQLFPGFVVRQRLAKSDMSDCRKQIVRAHRRNSGRNCR